MSCVLEREILEVANRARMQHGLPQLSEDRFLTAAARGHSRAMAEQEFFSHTSFQRGFETPMDRAKAAGAHIDGVGENIAMLTQSGATAEAFVQGWLDSPGHRKVLLSGEWLMTGVGVYSGGRDAVLATQLFAVPARLVLQPPVLDAPAAKWYFVKIALRIGVGHEAGVFVRNRFAVSALADSSGIATVEAEIACAAGSHHVGVGRRGVHGGGAWISVYEGTAEIRRDGSGVWHPGQTGDGVDVVSEALYRVDGSKLRLQLCGVSLEDLMLIVDGELRKTSERGPFRTELDFHCDTGIRVIDLGAPATDGQYAVLRRMMLDTKQGTLTWE
jgi:hypothetical protein